MGSCSLSDLIKYEKAQAFARLFIAYADGIPWHWWPVWRCYVDR